MKQKIKTDKTELVKSIIYKITDNDEGGFAPQMYFTLDALKFYVAETLWEGYDNTMSESEEQQFTKMQVFENTEYLFAYLDFWNWNVSRVIVNTTKSK